MKRFMALVTATALMAGSTAMVFAAETTTPAETPVAAEAPAEEAVPAEEVKEEVKEEVVKVELKLTEKSFTNAQGIILGKVPVFTGNEELTKKVALKAFDVYNQDLADNNIQAATKDIAIFDYVVTELDTVAKIELTKNITTTLKGNDNVTVYATYYINKADNKEIKEADYTALVPAVEEAPAVEEVPAEGETTAPTEPAAPAVELPATLALRANAEVLGFVVDWNEGKVTITKDDKTATLEQGVNQYTNFAGEVVTLASAPENVDGTLMVPTAFFTEILGATVTVNAEGVVSVVIEAAEAPAAEVTPAAEVEAPAAEAAPVENK